MLLGTSGAAQSFEAQQGPSDAISDLSWLQTPGSPHLLACSSWDKTVRVWAVTAAQKRIQTNPTALYNHEAPVLCCDISKNGCVFSGGCDKMLRMHNLQTNQTTVVGQHDQPICNVFVSEEKGFIITGGWDKTIKLWDTRSPTPGMTYNLTSKINAMDYKHPAMAVAKADRVISFFNMDNLSTQPAANLTANLRMQLRCVSLFPDKKGVGIGSIEGRCGILYMDAAMQPKNFPFKCHRVEDKTSGTKVYALNTLDFNTHGTFATGGADGSIMCWDKDCRQRLKGIEMLGHPVTKVKFDPSSELLAYSTSYDWHKGYAFSDPAKTQNKVYIHVAAEDMVKAPKNLSGRPAGRRL